MVQGKPTSNTEHSITVLFVMPVGNEGSYVMTCTISCYDSPVEVTSHPSVDTAFHSLADILENHDGQYDMPYGHRYSFTHAARHGWTGLHMFEFLFIGK